MAKKLGESAVFASGIVPGWISHSRLIYIVITLNLKILMTFNIKCSVLAICPLQVGWIGDSLLHGYLPPSEALLVVASGGEKVESWKLALKKFFPAMTYIVSNHLVISNIDLHIY